MEKQMELVIKISEEDYETLVNTNDSKLPSIISREHLFNAIATGTPLPRGHGDLKDADALWDAYHANDYDFYEALDDVPTIIEADKQEGKGMKISEIIKDKYKLRLPPTVYYDLLADVQEAEEEQEPCEDAISRQAVNTLVDELARAISDERCFMSRGRSTATIMQDILDLSPVNPQPKTGHWIFTDECHEHGRCSECGFGEVDLMMGLHDYCRRCGARMVDPQESEGKE